MDLAIAVIIGNVIVFFGVCLLVLLILISCDCEEYEGEDF